MDTTANTQIQGNGNTVQEAFVQNAKKAENAAFAPFGDDGFSFLDVLDIINPLQHIPVISTLYREATGDSLSAASRIAGGALFGGPIGAAASLVNVVVEEASGKDLGEHAMAMFEDGASSQEGGLQTADWPKGGLRAIPVESEELPPPHVRTVETRTDVDPVTDWAQTTTQGAVVAAATAGQTIGDPVSAWARHETRTRIAEAEAGRKGDNPVTAWARSETHARIAAAERGRYADNPVVNWARGESVHLAQLAAQGRVGGQAPADSNVLAVLQEAQQYVDASSAAHHQSVDLAENGREDRMAEAIVAEAINGSSGPYGLSGQAGHSPIDHGHRMAQIVNPASGAKG